MVTTSDAAENIDSDDIWHQLRRELEDVGISASVVEEHHAYICNWLKVAISNGMLEENASSAIKYRAGGSIDSGYGGSAGGSAYAPSIVPIAVANEYFENQMIRHPSRVHEDLPRSEPRIRKASGVSSVLFKLFKKETAIIEAASDGDLAKVDKLISQGANVNARDRWGVGFLSYARFFS